MRPLHFVSPGYWICVKWKRLWRPMMRADRLDSAMAMIRQMRENKRNDGKVYGVFIQVYEKVD